MVTQPIRNQPRWSRPAVAGPLTPADLTEIVSDKSIPIAVREHSYAQQRSDHMLPRTHRFGPLSLAHVVGCFDLLEQHFAVGEQIPRATCLAGHQSFFAIRLRKQDA
jgi:hypothetical protein